MNTNPRGTAAHTPGPQTLHPYCRACGWRKGGPDSWDGKRCKCGLYEPPLQTLMPAPEQKQ